MRKACFKCIVVAHFGGQNPRSAEYEATVNLSCMPDAESQGKIMGNFMEIVRTSPMYFINDCPSELIIADRFEVKQGSFTLL